MSRARRLLRRVARHFASPAADDPSVHSRRRFARRRRARRWSWWRPVLLLGLVTGLAGGAIWLALYSSVFSVAAVQVEGTDLLSEEQVRRAAAVPDGEPLARVDLTAVEGRLRALAPVRSVRVTRAWPDRIMVRVVERDVVAAVLIGSTLHGVDIDGVVFETFRSRPTGLPLIESRVDAASAQMREAMQEGAAVATAMPDELRARVDRIWVASMDRIALRLRGDRTVVWGSAEESQDKARVLAALIEARPGVRRYDVSSPSEPTTRG